jgi:amino acid adenylation domain-containing protein
VNGKATHILSEALLIQDNARLPLYPRDMTIPDLFAWQVANNPDRPAVLDGDTYLSYSDLDHLSNQVARQLTAEGVTYGDVVGTATGRSSETLILWISILKIGASYLPIDVASSPAMISAMFEDAEPRFVIADKESDFSPASKSSGCGPFIALDALLGSAQAQGGTPLTCPARPKSPAYVMFTSGSTGRPKGVVVPHRGVIRLVRDQTYVAFTENTVFLQISALAFDACTFEIWGALLNGGSIGIVSSNRLSIPQIGEAIARYGVTTMFFTSALFNAIVDVDIGALAGLREIAVGGDVVSPAHVARAMARFPDAQFINGYGPTEATTFSVCHRITYADLAGGAVPIGVPLNHTQAYVLHEDLTPVADGDIGQLWIGGDGVALGYLGRSNLSAERFRTDPFASDVDASMYATGDLVFRRPDGTIEFVGRNDRQIKIDGKRIELDAIELAFRKSASVADIAVSVLANDTTDKKIIAFVKAAKTAAADNFAQRLSDELRDTLPQYMLPAQIVMVTDFPLTANGKVDRTALMHLVRH